MRLQHPPTGCRLSDSELTTLHARHFLGLGLMHKRKRLCMCVCICVYNRSKSNSEAISDAYTDHVATIELKNVEEN